ASRNVISSAMGTVHEWYGYLATDQSATAASSATQHHCPFLNGACRKTGGVCSVEPAPGQPVAVCPVRMYYDDYRNLKLIAADAFGDFSPVLAPSGLPALVPGTNARAAASNAGQHQVGVFGTGWGGEIQLPPAHQGGGGRYSVDFVLVAVAPAGDLV